MRRIFLPLVSVVFISALAGCGSSGGDDYDPNKIAVKQPGDGPPPMKPPMSEGGTAPGQ